MGNRATVQFIDKHDAIGVTVYLHWHGGDVEAWLRNAAPNMRAGDSGYAAARFIAYCANHIDGGLSLGVYNAPFDAGDNGLHIVNCDTGEVTRSVDEPSYQIELGQF